MKVRTLLRWLGRVTVSLIAVTVAYVLLAAIAAWRVAYPLTGQAPGPGEFRGAVHVHTRDSDGSGSMEDVARAAKIAGLGFVVTTDHNREEIPPPRFVDGVLMVHGVELSTPSGHLVALGLEQGLTAEERRTRPIERVAQRGGTSFLAHPIQRRNPWRDWMAANGVQGMELYSGDTMWRSLLADPARLACVAGALLTNRAHAALSMVEVSPQAEERLLELSASYPRVALCSHDAHGIPPYHWAFPMMSIHLQKSHSPDARQAAADVLGALTSGEGICVFDALGSADGLALEGTLRPGRRVWVGEKLRIVLPQVGGAKVRVRVAGAGAVGADGLTVTWNRPGPAFIQVELWAPNCLFGHQWRPWVVLSPILVEATGP